MINIFQYCTFSFQTIQVCDLNIGRPQKITGNFSDSSKIAEIFQNLEQELKNLPIQTNRI